MLILVIKKVIICNICKEELPREYDKDAFNQKWATMLARREQ